MNVRLRRFMVHLCDLYKPMDISGYTGEMADTQYSPFPAYTGVACHCQSTPEFDNPMMEGLTKETNVLTSDKWHFLQDQPLADAWMIVMRTPGHPDYGAPWIIQGNPLMNASAPGRPSGSQWVPAKLTSTVSIPTSSIVASVAVVVKAVAVVH